MKFEYIGNGSIGYGGLEVKKGDVVEYTDHFEEKAKKNPDYRLIKPRKKRTVVKDN
jgi:hypothetical protein